MKKLILPALILAAFSACTQSQKKTEIQAFEKGPIEILTTYPNTSDAIIVSYNENNQVTKTASTETNFITYTNNEKGLPVKAEFYFDNKLDHYKTIEWHKDSISLIKTIIAEGGTVENIRDAYFFNENKEMTQIIRYKKDSLGAWQKSDSKYEFEWVNGNLLKMRCLVPKEYVYDDSTIMEQQSADKSLIDLPEIGDENSDGNYTVFYESTYTYDNKSNPFQKSSLAQLIIPYKHNISNNNPLTIDKKYTTGEEIKINFRYDYNEKGYPTMLYAIVLTNVEGFEKMEYTREFKY